MIRKSVGAQPRSQRGSKYPALNNRSHEDVSLEAFQLFREAVGKPAVTFESSLTEYIDPVLYSDVREFLPDYWATESFSKMPCDIGIDREAQAIKGFLDAEDLCIAITPSLVFNGSWTEEFSCLVSRIRRRLAWLLGGITPLEVIQRARWSSGASTSLPRKRANPQNKWGLATHMTSGTTWWMQLWNSKFQDQAFRNCEVVDSNRLLTVPKNAKINRVIAAEPDWNMFFQLGMGACIRRRLQRVGLLRSPREGERVHYNTDAQARQQHFAWLGSRTGNYATIDLKAASDSISLVVCDLLLPPSLFRMLCQLRSPKGILPDGSTVTYEKISSMGNGSTFELETSLFWAIACEAAGSEEDVLVYGDDIIVPTNAATRVIDALASFGFTANPKKTHISGPFRESCGGHYFNGFTVTPPYFRKLLDRPSSVITGYNSLCQRIESNSVVSPVLAQSLLDSVGSFLRRRVPRLLFGPPGLDGCLGVPFQEFLAISKARRVDFPAFHRNNVQFNGHCGGLRLLEVPSQDPSVPEWGLVHALYGANRASLVPSGESRYKVATWSSLPWSTMYPY